MAVVTTLDELRAGNVLRGDAISMRVIDVEGGMKLRNDDADEVLYILERDTGIHLPRGVELELEGAMTLIGVAAGFSRPDRLKPVPTQIRLEDQPIQRTGDRWYRELIQGEMTQFVGSIPPGRAPDHFHLYEEVICILQGSGVMRTGNSNTPVGPGSCVYLPRREVHCLENSGSGELRLLGVFYPAGSPAVRYDVHQSAGSSPGEGQLDRRR